MKKQETQEESLTLPSSCPRDSGRETCFRKEILGGSHRLIGIKHGHQKASRQVPVCPIGSESPSKESPCSSSTTCKSIILTSEIEDPVPHFLLCPNMSSITHVASLSLERSWNYCAYVNSPFACIKL